MDSQKTIQN